jgi:ribose-phosphate pyrophosphokinase
MGRAIYLANVLGVDMGMFYKRRDYTKVINGSNRFWLMNIWDRM